jgi:hypothetical protein
VLARLAVGAAASAFHTAPKASSFAAYTYTGRKRPRRFCAAAASCAVAPGAIERAGASLLRHGLFEVFLDGAQRVDDA